MNCSLGVDISHHNGNVDFTKLKATGHANFVVVRVSYGTTLDRKFERNVSICKSLNIPYAFYWYGRFATVEGAKKEANYVLSKIAGTSPLFVAYDAECAALSALDKYSTTDVAWAALEVIKNAGYTPYIYSNENWRQNEIDIVYLKNKGVKFWYARYNGRTPSNTSYASICDIWQYSDSGKLNGNGSQYIDLDVCYDETINSKISGISTVDYNYTDTTLPVDIKKGQTYMVATGSNNVTTGNSAIIQTAGQFFKDGKYYTKIKAVGSVGQSAGVYLNGKRIFVVNVV